MLTTVEEVEVPSLLSQFVSLFSVPRPFERQPGRHPDCQGKINS